MSKSKKQKKLPKRVDDLTGDDVMAAIFGKAVQEELKDSANPPAPPASQDQPPPTLTV